MNKKILVIDDEKKIVEVIKSYLENSGYLVLEAYEGKTGLALFEKYAPALVILDLMLPDTSGEELCHKMQSLSATPVIMLTAKVDEESIINGLSIGADDYVTKPFSPRQLMARVEAVLRRSAENSCKSYSFNTADLVLNDENHEVLKKGVAVNLTPSEYNILLTMMRSPKRTFKRDELLDESYDGFDRTVDTHIKNLRQKIEDNPKEPVYILTVHGVGYKFGGEN